MITTERLRLIPCTLTSLEAELASPARLADVLGIEVSQEWPPELYDRDPILFTIDRLHAAPHEAGWWLYYIARIGTNREADVAIGCGGYKGPPSADGTVEIGYSIVPAARRQGYACEAVVGLVQHAFAVPAVRRVIAETLPDLTPSIGVLEKCGFRFIGDGSEEGVIRYELTRAEHASQVEVQH